MTREKSWEVEGEAPSVLQALTTAGYVVSVHRLPPSLLRFEPPATEMHALDLGTDPPTQHIARVSGENSPANDLVRARLLAEMAERVG